MRAGGQCAAAPSLKHSALRSKGDAVAFPGEQNRAWWEDSETRSLVGTATHRTCKSVSVSIPTADWRNAGEENVHAVVII